MLHPFFFPLGIFRNHSLPTLSSRYTVDNKRVPEKGTAETAAGWKMTLLQHIVTIKYLSDQIAIFHQPRKCWRGETIICSDLVWLLTTICPECIYFEWFWPFVFQSTCASTASPMWNHVPCFKPVHPFKPSSKWKLRCDFCWRLLFGLLFAPSKP